MSRLTELIAHIKNKDPQIGVELEREFKEHSSRLAFGLNFERHRPEVVELPNRTVRRGDKVRKLSPRGKKAKIDPRIWSVKKISVVKKSKFALIEITENKEVVTEEVLVDDLAVIAEFRDYLYPGLISTGKIEKGDDKPFHTVINGENYHVLKALTYSHRGAVDAIYIDPPYNTGAKDWKYNNNYVETEDLYRHSKWLAFMERRLVIAKSLLNPNESVLIVTIDEKEYLRLGLLLEQTFPEANIQMVTSVISPFGVARRDELARVEEYIYYCSFGTASLGAPNDSRVLLTSSESEESNTGDNTKKNDETFWFSLMRAGTDSKRDRSPGCFYPIYLSEDEEYHSTGEALARGTSRDSIKPPKGTIAVWPINQEGDEARWQMTSETAKALFKKGYARIGRFNKSTQRHSITYLRTGTIKRIENGGLEIDSKGKITVIQEASTSGRTVWAFDSHNATSHGTKLLKKFLPDRRFPFPKSLYAVEDSLRVFLENKKNALVLDFFSGSGTTAHAVMRLNKQDEGCRRTILVTNNEVSAEEQSSLRAKGLRPGDADWEKLGICNYITKPRVESAITGIATNGKKISGDYKFIDKFKMSEGFKENAEFFDLTYETSMSVSYNLAFKRIAPLLWMRAGSQGKRINSIPKSGYEVADSYGLLVDLDRATDFYKQIRKGKNVRVAYIVTNDDRRFQIIIKRLPSNVEPVRLYESYLKNFEIMSGE